MSNLQPATLDQGSLTIMLAELRRQVDAQVSRRRHIESKATVFLGLFAVMVSLVIGQWTLAAPWGYPFLQLLGLLALLATLAAIIASLWPRDLDDPPEPEKLYALHKSAPADVDSALVDSFRKAYKKNQAVMKCKVRCLKASYCLLAADIAIVVTPFVVQAVSSLRR